MKTSVLLLAVCATIALDVGCADDPNAEPPANNLEENNPNNNPLNNPLNNPNNNPLNNPSGNRAPELAKIGNKRGHVGEELSFQVQADDPDGDVLSFSVFGSLPVGAKFDKSAAAFSWTPGDDQNGSFVILTFAVSDGDLDDRETIQISVDGGGGGNIAPELVDPGDQVLEPGQPFQLRLEGTDEDGDTLTYTIDGPSPSGASLDRDTGLFRWTPAPSDVGQSYDIVFVVSDGTDKAEARVKLLVSDVRFDVADVPPQEVHLGQQLSFALVIDNPDGLTVTCRAVDAPPNAQLEPDTCTFTWTPTDATLVGTAVEVLFVVEATGGAEPIRLNLGATISVLDAPSTNNPQGCEADGLEPNTRSRATGILQSDYAQQALTLCNGDEDWFRINLNQAESLLVEIASSDASGDLDLQIYEGGAEDPLATAATNGSNERLVLAAAPDTDTYYVRVFGIVDVGVEYSITVSKNVPVACTNDGAEPNDTPSTATAVADGHLEQYAICPGDLDTFVVEVAGGDTLRATITFDVVPDLDLDLVVTGPDSGTWTSAGITDTEEVVIEGAVAGSYFIQVLGYLPADAGDYLLEVAVSPRDPCDADSSEPNNSSDAATILFNPNDLLAEQTACGDPDWFNYSLAAGASAWTTIDSDGVADLTLQAFDTDGTSLLDTGIISGRYQDVLVGPFDSSKMIFFVVEGAGGITYSIEVVGL